MPRTKSKDNAKAALERIFSEVLTGTWIECYVEEVTPGECPEFRVGAYTDNAGSVISVDSPENILSSILNMLEDIGPVESKGKVENNATRNIA